MSQGNPTSHPGRTGLAEMVAAARHDGASHLMLADWLEENLGRADVAAVLRQSKTDPRVGSQVQKTRLTECRSAPLDSEVSLYMARWQVAQPNNFDPAVSLIVRQGHHFALCVSLEADIGLRRWVRWLEDRGEPTAVVTELWEKLEVIEELKS